MRFSKTLTVGLVGLLAFAGNSWAASPQDSALQIPPPKKGTIRVATFNVALNRKTDGQLVSDLQSGSDQVARLATIVQLVSPDILLTNEVDYCGGKAAELLRDAFQKKSAQGNVEAIDFPYHFVDEVNTGVDSGLDLNLNGRLHDSDDRWGYGAFPGQYGMAVFSRFPIDTASVRTFQKLRWSQMPGALRPRQGGNPSGTEPFFHSDAVWQQLRLSSKSHWDVPIQIHGSVLHILTLHPTPPVFDGPEDRNGCRNHDEIRLVRDYVAGGDAAKYIVDDSGKQGGLASDSPFVILGDLNADPKDGSGLSQGIVDLLQHPRVSANFVPQSQGAVEAASEQAKANSKHRGDPAHDTGDFNDEGPGNLRVDFVLPSNNCKIVGGGVFWPTKKQLESFDPELVDASDHHLVWLDIQLDASKD